MIHKTVTIQLKSNIRSNETFIREKYYLRLDEGIDFVFIIVDFFSSSLFSSAYASLLRSAYVSQCVNIRLCISSLSSKTEANSEKKIFEIWKS